VRTSHVTAKRKLADLQLDGGLDAHVSRARNLGTSWRQISLDLREAIELDIHPETLRLWYADELTVAAS